MAESIRPTQYSHGAGCGCKISPEVPDVILAGTELAPIGAPVVPAEYVVEVA